MRKSHIRTVCTFLILVVFGVFALTLPARAASVTDAFHALLESQKNVFRVVNANLIQTIFNAKQNGQTLVAGANVALSESAINALETSVVVGSELQANALNPVDRTSSYLYCLFNDWFGDDVCGRSSPSEQISLIVKKSTTTPVGVENQVVARPRKVQQVSPLSIFPRDIAQGEGREVIARQILQASPAIAAQIPAGISLEQILAIVDARLASFAQKDTTSAIQERIVTVYNSNPTVGYIEGSGRAITELTNRVVAIENGSANVDLSQALAVTDTSTSSIAGALIVERNLALSQYLTLSSYTPANTSNALYNVGGTLYWNGSAVGGSGGAWSTSGADVYRLTGNVGIGTSTPQAPLSVVYSNNSFGRGLTITNTNGGSNAISGLAITDKNGTYKGVLDYLDSNYNNAAIANTVLFGTPGNTKLAFIGGTGSGNPDIYFQSGWNVTPAIYIKGSSSNVGIGTTTPSAKLEVVGDITSNGVLSSVGTASAAAQLYLVDDVNGYGGIDIYTYGGAAVGSPHSYINLVSSRGSRNSVSNLQSNDDVGMLNFYGQTDSGLELAAAIGAVAVSNFSGSSVPSDLFFMTNKTEKMRITSSGNVGIGTTTPQQKLMVLGTVGVNSNTSNIGFSTFYSGSGGRQYDLLSCYNCGSAGLGGFEIYDASVSATRAYIQADVNGWQTPSDIRLKDNIETLSVLDKLSEIRGTSYTLRGSNIAQIGVIAQEIKIAFPEAVSGSEENGRYLGVSYNAIASIALQGVKEIWQKLEGVVAWFGNGGDRFNVQGDICVDDVCLSKEQFKQLLQSNGGQINQNNVGGQTGGTTGGSQSDPEIPVATSTDPIGETASTSEPVIDEQETDNPPVENLTPEPVSPPAQDPESEPAPTPEPVPQSAPSPSEPAQ